MRLLLVEDDHRTADYIVKGLTEAGHVCDLLRNGHDALFAATSGGYDVIVADRMGLDVWEVIRLANRHRARQHPPVRPGQVSDRVDGLQAGGDDYLVKPFAFSELLARIHALGRRPATQEQKTVLRVGDLEMDLIMRRVTRQGQPIDLQPREFSLLEVLMRGEGRVITRTMLLERVWDFHFDPKTSVVETHISRLRAKIDKPFETQLLHTVRNTGYSLHAPLAP